MAEPHLRKEPNQETEALVSSIRTVCVFAASSEAVSDSRRRVAAALGRAIAEQGGRSCTAGEASG